MTTKTATKSKKKLNLAAAAGPSAADAFVAGAPDSGKAKSNTANMGRPTDRNTSDLKRLSLDIAKQLHKDVKNMATELEESMVSVVERYLREGLDRDRAKVGK